VASPHKKRAWHAQFEPCPTIGGPPLSCLLFFPLNGSLFDACPFAVPSSHCSWACKQLRLLLAGTAATEEFAGLGVTLACLFLSSCSPNRNIGAMKGRFKRIFTNTWTSFEVGNLWSFKIKIHQGGEKKKTKIILCK
jgi:hypothetical protein